MINLYDIIKEMMQLVKLQVSDVNIEADNRDSLEWFLDESQNKNSTDIQTLIPKRMHLGKIHIFKYNPLTKDRLSYWDVHPIVLSLGRTKTDRAEYLEHGLNISWWPPKARKYLMESIQKLHSSKYNNLKKGNYSAIDQDEVRLDLYKMKRALDKYGLSFALRSYYPSYMISNLSVVSYQQWHRAMDLDASGMFPIVKGGPSIKTIYREFDDYLKKYQKNRNRYLNNIDEAKRKGSYDFIK